MLFFDKDAGDGNGSGGGQAVEVLKVGDKEYSANDVKGLVTELGGLKEHEQTISQLTSMAKTFEMDVGEFSQQGLAALRVVNDLIESGVIDETGKVVEKPADGKGGKGKGGDKDDDLFNLDKDGDKNKGKAGGKDKGVSEDMLETIQKLMEPIQTGIKDLTDRVSRSEAVTTGILEQDFTNKIIGKFPNLTAADTKSIFGLARADKTKGLWEHAEEFSKNKANEVIAIQKDFAEKHGLNYDELNENLLREQETKDGAPPVKEGARITFRKGIKGGISPGKLAGSYLKERIG